MSSLLTGRRAPPPPRRPSDPRLPCGACPCRASSLAAASRPSLDRGPVERRVSFDALQLDQTPSMILLSSTTVRAGRSFPSFPLLCGTPGAPLFHPDRHHRRNILMPVTHAFVPTIPVPGEFAGRRALVTGGSRGIGAAVAQQLIDGGATVVTSARNRTDDTPKESTFI